MSSRINLLGALVATVVVVLAMSMFTVEQRQFVVVVVAFLDKGLVHRGGVASKRGPGPARACRGGGW